MKFPPPLSIIVALCGLSHLAQCEEIKGEVFIVTAGGDNKRLGRVTVLVLDLQATKDALATRIGMATELRPRLLAKVVEKEAVSQKEGFSSPRHKEAFDEYLDWLCVSSYYRSGLFFFPALPAPVATIKTDSEGKYSVTVPAGHYAIAATADRAAGNHNETYVWLISVDLPSGGSVDGTLSNDNMSSAKGGGGIIATCTPGQEADNAVKGAPIAEKYLAKLNAPPPVKPAPLLALPRPKTVQEAQALAVERFPDLGVAGTKLNKAFLEKVQAYRQAGSSIFKDPEWPLLIAEECAKQ